MRYRTPSPAASAAASAPATSPQSPASTNSAHTASIQSSTPASTPQLSTPQPSTPPSTPPSMRRHRVSRSGRNGTSSNNSIIGGSRRLFNRSVHNSVTSRNSIFSPEPNSRDHMGNQRTNILVPRRPEPLTPDNPEYWRLHWQQFVKTPLSDTFTYAIKMAPYEYQEDINNVIYEAICQSRLRM